MHKNGAAHEEKKRRNKKIRLRHKTEPQIKNNDKVFKEGKNHLPSLTFFEDEMHFEQLRFSSEDLHLAADICESSEGLRVERRSR